MDRSNLIEFFQSSGLVSAQKAAEIAEHFAPYSIQRNEFFLKEGKVSDQYLFLEEGFMRAFSYDTEGNDITTAFFKQKSVVFEVFSFFTRTPSRENIVALTDSHGWMVTFDQLNHLFHALPEFREFGRSVLVRGYSTLKMRMLSMITETAEQRYERLMDTNAEIFQHAPLKHIATYLGVTDSSLSRIRKELAKK